MRRGRLRWTTRSQTAQWTTDNLWFNAVYARVRDPNHMLCRGCGGGSSAGLHELWGGYFLMHLVLYTKKYSCIAVGMAQL